MSDGRRVSLTPTLAKVSKLLVDKSYRGKGDFPTTNAISNSLVLTAVPVERAQSAQSSPPASKVSPSTTQSADAQGAYTVHISDAAKAMQAMMQEATETSYQTAQEASHGDLQAKRLLAKEEAAKKLMG